MAVGTITYQKHITCTCVYVAEDTTCAVQNASKLKPNSGSKLRLKMYSGGGYKTCNQMS